MTASDSKTPLPVVIVVAGSVAVLLGMGIRASQGLYLKPMSVDLGWGREVFAFAMAMQNLLWGAFQPFAAAMTEKWGTGRVVAGGGVMYFLGLYVMSISTDPLTFNFSAGLLLGMAQSGCALGAVLGAVGRALPENKRTFGLGTVTAAGAAGQFTVVPIGQEFLNQYGWSTSFVLLGLMSVVIVLAAWFLRGRPAGPKPRLEGAAAELGMGGMLSLASKDKSFWFLTAGFFVCGFHVAFITVHMPAYLSDKGLPTELGAYSLMLIGLFNVIGSFAAGALGTRFSKKYLLSTLYSLRAVTIALFIMVPISTPSVLVFSAAMGILWLSTVPLTSGLVATIYGTRFMGTLFGIVFFSHQVGSFLGVWLGGYFYDTTGSYDPIWWAGIALGFIAALLHWPIKEQTVPQAVNA
ncbi:MAG: MFS transporter [Rhodospirillaceae bacterium]